LLRTFSKAATAGTGGCLSPLLELKIDRFLTANICVECKWLGQTHNKRLLRFPAGYNARKALCFYILNSEKPYYIIAL
jgi:hypothetical protein